MRKTTKQISQSTEEKHIPGMREDQPQRKIWKPSHHLKSNGAAKYVLGLGMLPKLYKGRIHVLAKVPKVLK